MGIRNSARSGTGILFSEGRVTPGPSRSSAGMKGLESLAESADSLKLIAALRREQRNSWQSGERVAAEAYLQRHPELQAESEAVLELIYNEIVIRQRLGEAPRQEEYQQRFPHLAAQLELLFEVDSALETCPLPAASDLTVEGD